MVKSRLGKPQVVRTAELTHGEGEVGAAFDRRVIGNDHTFSPCYHSYAMSATDHNVTFEETYLYQ